MRDRFKVYGRKPNVVKHTPIPADFPVQPLAPDAEPTATSVTCGHCGLRWDDAIVTGWTPAPSARCPFEYFHVYPADNGR